jgi:hypothetical protein
MTKYNSILKNDVWETVPKSSKELVIESKHKANQCIEEYKDKFFTIGFSQKEGVDHNRTFSLVVRSFEVHGKDTDLYKLKKPFMG